VEIIQALLTFPTLRVQTSYRVSNFDFFFQNFVYVIDFNFFRLKY